jgi:hypothetical protein
MISGMNCSRKETIEIGERGGEREKDIRNERLLPANKINNDGKVCLASHALAHHGDSHYGRDVSTGHAYSGTHISECLEVTGLAL